MKLQQVMTICQQAGESEDQPQAELTSFFAAIGFATRDGVCVSVYVVCRDMAGSEARGGVPPVVPKA